MKIRRKWVFEILFPEISPIKGLEFLWMWNQFESRSMEPVLDDMAITPTADMKDMQEGCGGNPVVEEVLSKRKSESPIEESLKRMKDGDMEVSPEPKLASTISYDEFKMRKCKSFRRGVELRKGHASLLGSDGRVMNLVAQENGTFWDGAL